MLNERAISVQNSKKKKKMKRKEKEKEKKKNSHVRTVDKEKIVGHRNLSAVFEKLILKFFIKNKNIQKIKKINDIPLNCLLINE